MNNKFKVDIREVLDEVNEHIRCVESDKRHFNKEVDDYLEDYCDINTVDVEIGIEKLDSALDSLKCIRHAIMTRFNVNDDDIDKLAGIIVDYSSERNELIKLTNDKNLNTVSSTYAIDCDLIYNVK